MDITYLHPSFPDGDLLVRSHSHPNQYHRVHTTVLEQQPNVFDPVDLAGREGPFGRDGLWRVTSTEDIEEITTRVSIAYMNPQ